MQRKKWLRGRLNESMHFQILRVAVPQIDLLEMTDAQWNGGMALKFHGARRLTVRAWLL